MQSSGKMTDREVFLVTGASKGLGRCICQLLCNMGFVVIGLARDSPQLRELDNELKSKNPQSSAIICDLSKPDEINKVGAMIKQDYPTINGVVHNAGIIGPVGSMFDVDVGKWNETMMVNLQSVQQLTKVIFPVMRNAEHCRVTTISSGAAVNSLESWSAYCTSKAGLEMWTKCLADEGAEDGISAISIAPGIVDTGMQATIRSVSEEDFPMVSKFVEFHEEGHLVPPQDVAKSLLNLITKHKFEQSGQRFDVRDL